MISTPAAIVHEVTITPNLNSTHRTSNTPHPIIRPGRKIHKPNIDTYPHRSYGQHWEERQQSDLRIFFQNIKGLTYSATGEDNDYYLSSLKLLEADIVGMAETNTVWTHPHLQSLFTARARQHLTTAKINFSSPTQEIDPTPVNKTYQSGGTSTLSTNSMVSMALGDDIRDPTGLGRWSGQTYRAKDYKVFTVITVYRVCTGSIATLSVGSAFSREYEHI
jgi:hypothetical protein